MQQKFLINVSILILANLLVKPFWIFGIDRTVQNLVGPELYGMYFAVFNFSVIFYVISDLGLNHHFSQSIASGKDQIKETFWKIFAIKSTLGIVYFGICMGSALLLGYESSALYILTFLVINQLFTSILLFARYSFTGLHWFKVDSFFSVLDRIIAIVICAVLIWGIQDGPAFQIQWLVYAQTAALGSSALLALIVLWYKLKPTFLMPDKAFIRRHLKAALPFAFLFIWMSLYQKADGVMIERMLSNGKEEAGIYAASYRLLDAFSMIGFLFAGILIPIYARMIAQKENLAELFRISSTMLISFSLIVSVLGVIYRIEIMSLLYHTDNPYWSKVFSLVILALNGTCMMYAFSSPLTANRSLGSLNRLAFSGFVMNISLNLFLIPAFQAYGAALATLITQSFIALAQLLLNMKVFSFRTDIQLIFKLLAFSFLIILGFIGMTWLPIAWYWSLLCCLPLGLVLAMITGMLDLKWIGQLLSARINS